MLGNRLVLLKRGKHFASVGIVRGKRGASMIAAQGDGISVTIRVQVHVCHSLFVEDSASLGVYCCKKRDDRISLKAWIRLALVSGFIFPVSHVSDVGCGKDSIENDPSLIAAMSASNSGQGSNHS